MLQRIALASALLAAIPVSAATVAQETNPYDRPFERLDGLHLVRGAMLKSTSLEITDAAGQDWTVSADAAWMSFTPESGTGDATVTVTFDAAMLNAGDDQAATITVDVDAGTETLTLPVAVDMWPHLAPEADHNNALRSWLRDPANWPSDSSYHKAWQWWGFLPDTESHPGTTAGANMENWEKTECSANNPDGDDCVSPGQAGLAAGLSGDAAWLLSTGDPRTLVAVLDSGIKWHEREVLTKHFLNADELRNCAPPGADVDAVDAFAAFDVNGDGVFNIRDYDKADWIEDLNRNGLRDPQDIIHGASPDGPCSDGVDDDSNGYVDDISGWDFFWNDNDPSDDSDFGHGTGEARDSTAEAHNDSGELGLCPRCMVLSVRVGDSFVVDVNQYADGVIFAVESGAHLVQEALGSINNSPYGQMATDYAYHHNVPIVASAADERSYHHNYPGNYEHTLYVHAIVADTDGDYEDASSFLNFGNCTNYGARLTLSTPGTGCSSEATGNTSGQVGLLISYFMQLQDAATGDDVAYYEAPLTSQEVYQVLTMTADDIDVPGAEQDPAALDLQKYPSNEGWDLHFGYGRNNARRSLEALRDKRIPPEADITTPRWFETIDPVKTPSLEIKGTVSSPRLTNLRWTLQVSDGVLTTDPQEVATGTGPVDDDVLGTLDLSTSGPLGELVRRASTVGGSDDPERFTATLELVVTGEGPAGDVVGVFRKAFSVHHDETLKDGFPMYLGASGESSPRLTDLDGDGTEEIVVATADGRVHAISQDGTELPGFPVLVNGYPALSDEVCSAQPEKCHRTARAFQSGTPYGIDPAAIHSSIDASVAIGDLDGDGSPGRDIVIGTMDGTVYAFSSTGEVLDGFPVTLDPAFTAEFEKALTCVKDGETVIGCNQKQRFAEYGVFSSPLLTDLDGDGDLEMVVGGMDQHAYAWHHDGTEVNGWPVLLRYEVLPAFDSEGGVLRHDGRIISTPCVGDLFGDGTKVVFFGTNERRENSNESYLYGIWQDGNAHEGGAFPPGWPARLSGFIPDEILPFLGRGAPNAPICGDFDDDGKDEVVSAGLGGFVSVIDETAKVEFSMASTGNNYGPDNNVDEPAGSLPVINSPSAADLDGDGRMDLVNGTAGLGLVSVASNGGLRAEFDHSVSAWVVENGYFQDGFPHRVNDYQFFMNYIVADLDGSGLWNVISGDGGYHVYAPDQKGVEAEAFPKYTAGWHIASPAVGDLDGDDKIDVIANTREGWLFAWTTDGHVRGSGDIPAIQWASFHHDDANTGNIHTPLTEYQKITPPDDEKPGECACDAGSSQGTPVFFFGVLGLLGLATLRKRRQ